MSSRMYLTAAEAAERLGTKEARIRALVKRGLIAHRRDGRFLRFTEADLEEYVEATKVPRASPFQTTRAKTRKP
ncbi:MAG: helix-turn-helix domain-containing protein [Nocardioides sp.]